MKNQLFALVIPENFFDFIFACYLALLGKKVAVVADKKDVLLLEKASIINPQSSSIICNHLGISPAPKKDEFEPDFQIISSRYRLDFFSNRKLRKFAFERDLAQKGEKLIPLIDELLNQSIEFENQIKQIQLISQNKLTALFKRFFPASIGQSTATLQSLFEQFELDDELKKLILAPLKFLSPYFYSDFPLLSSSLLWRFFLSCQEETSEEKENISDFITESVLMIEAPPEHIKLTKKAIAGIKLSSGEEIIARYYFSSPQKIFSLLDENERESRSAHKLASIFARTTFALHKYEIDEEIIPEALACRVLAVYDSPPNEMLLTITESKGKKELFISYVQKKTQEKALGDDEIFARLKLIFPWLAEDQIKPAQKPRFFHQYLRFHQHQLKIPNLRTPIKNLFLPASELMPFFGIDGLFHLAETISQKES